MARRSSRVRSSGWCCCYNTSRTDRVESGRVGSTPSRVEARSFARARNSRATVVGFSRILTFAYTGRVARALFKPAGSASKRDSRAARFLVRPEPESPRIGDTRCQRKGRRNGAGSREETRGRRENSSSARGRRAAGELHGSENSRSCSLSMRLLSTFERALRRATDPRITPHAFFRFYLLRLAPTRN